MQTWSSATVNLNPELSCVKTSQSFTRPQNLCVNWPAPAHHACVSKHTFNTHTSAQYLIHAPHTSARHVSLSSFLFIHNRLWCGIPRSLRGPGEWSGVDLLSCSSDRLPIDPPAALALSFLPLSFCLSIFVSQLPSVPFNYSPFSAIASSVLPLKSIITWFSSSPQMKVITPSAVDTALSAAAAPLSPQPSVTWALRSTLLILLNNHLECAVGLRSSALPPCLHVGKVEDDVSVDKLIETAVGCALHFLESAVSGRQLQVLYITR